MKRSAKCRPVQFRSNLFECQNRYYFFFFFFPLPLSTPPQRPCMFCFPAIYIYISLFRIIRIDPVVASYLNLISYFFSTSVNDAAPSVPTLVLRFVRVTGPK